MLQEIIPNISCIASYPEIDEAISKYAEVYITAPEGNFKHVKLPLGRHVRLKVDRLPEVKLENPRQVVLEELNFLPAGKIPSSMFDQIVEFFRQVIEIKKANFEAHAWILWNKERGYYISVPPQTVGGASVKFDYTDEALPKGDLIVVDLHSHNSMGAFYSSTDNRSDQSGIYYSGVIGKLTTTSYEWVMRFNLYETKKSCTLEEIFSFPEEATPNVPKDWLDQVKVNAPPKMPKGGWTNNRPSNLPSLYDTEREAWAKQWMRPEDSGEESLSDFTKKMNLEKQINHFRLEYNTRPKWVKEDFPLETFEEYVKRRYPDMEASGKSLKKKLEKKSQMEELITQEDELELQAELFFENQFQEISINPQTGLLDSSYVPGPQDEEKSTLYGEYEYYVSKYTVDVAEAKDTIDHEILDLSGCDEALLDVIRQAYEMMGETGRVDLATNGF